FLFERHPLVLTVCGHLRLLVRLSGRLYLRSALASKLDFDRRDFDGGVHAKISTPNSPTPFRLDLRMRCASMSPSTESMNAVPRPFMSRRIGLIFLRSISGT